VRRSPAGRRWQRTRHPVTRESTAHRYGRRCPPMAMKPATREAPAGIGRDIAARAGGVGDGAGSIKRGPSRARDRRIDRAPCRSSRTPSVGTHISAPRSVQAWRRRRRRPMTREQPGSSRGLPGPPAVVRHARPLGGRRTWRAARPRRTGSRLGTRAGRGSLPALRRCGARVRAGDASGDAREVPQACPRRDAAASRTAIGAESRDQFGGLYHSLCVDHQTG